MPILLGNSYALRLIRRPVAISPARMSELHERAANQGVVFYWRHANTSVVAGAILRFYPTLRTKRPAIALDKNLLPILEGMVFYKT